MAARPEFPAVLRSRRGDGLPLHVGNCVGAAAGERHDVILPVTRTGAGRSPGRWARVYTLELPCTSRDRYSLAKSGLETRAAINATLSGRWFSSQAISPKPGEPQNREGRQHRGQPARSAIGCTTLRRGSESGWSTAFGKSEIVPEANAGAAEGRGTRDGRVRGNPWSKRS